MYELRRDSSMDLRSRNRENRAFRPKRRQQAPPSGIRRAQSPAVSVEHYENFPVASWLCPPALRPAVRAIYWFARTADDIADEGDATAAARQEALAAYRDELARAAAGQPVSARWRGVFEPLAMAIRVHALPPALLAALLDAFEEDTRHAGYADRAALLHYCSRSANPVGRLLLHLHGLDDPELQRRSDAVCSALQLVNFWQDLSVDLPRGRRYLPREDCRVHGLADADFDRFAPLAATTPPSAAIALVASEVAWARGLMQEGAPLVHRLPGRAGWELRFVVQGGSRILDKIEAQGCDSFSARPTLVRGDAALLAWRALRMRRQSAA